MTSLLLAPHNDDETLFAAFTILRFRPKIVTCFRSHVQERRGGPSWETREGETQAALAHLGGSESWTQLKVRDDQPDPEMLASLLTDIETLTPFTRVFAPAIEAGGHDQHNLVGALATQIFGADRVTSYLTYRRGYGKSRSANEIRYGSGWMTLKMRAMAEYQSQIDLDNCAYWFIDETLREWYE